MSASRRAPPRGVVMLAGLFGLFTCALLALTAMASGMTRDPNVPLPASIAIVALLAAFTLFLAWITWGILRGKPAIAQRLLSKDPTDVSPLFDPGIVLDLVVRRLLSSEESRRWFGLPPPE